MRKKDSKRGLSKRDNIQNYETTKLFSEKANKATIVDDFVGNIHEYNLDRIYNKSSETMNEIPDNSIALMVTSPPYNVGMEYEDNLPFPEYLDMLGRVFGETYRKLVSGGRACINIANIGRKPYIPLTEYVTEIMLKIGYLMRGSIIWDKGASVGGSTAWGSWQSASNPVLRDVHEYILVFSKEAYKRDKGEKINTIQKRDFLDNTKSIWRFPTVSAKKTGHPAPFPEALPKHCIELYSFRKDIVLDPFCGAGSTCIAAIKSGRHFVGYEIVPEYVELSYKRLLSLYGQLELFDIDNQHMIPVLTKLQNEPMDLQ